jgi:hypothetical protein
VMVTARTANLEPLIADIGADRCFAGATAFWRRIL